MSNDGPPHTSNNSILANTALRNTVWVTLGTYLGQFVGFGATLILTRILDNETFGAFALATVWAGWIGLRSKIALNSVTIQQQTQLNGELLGTYYALDMFLAVVSCGLSFVVIWLFPLLGYKPEIGRLLVSLVLAESLATLVSPLSLALEKEIRLGHSTVVNLLASISAYGVAVGLALNGWKSESLVAINVVSTLINVIGVYIICRSLYPHIFIDRWRFNWSLAQTLIKRGVVAGLSLSALASILSQFDNFLIGTFVGQGTLGFYDRAYRIASWPNIIITVALTRVAFLTFAKVKDDLPRLTHAMRLALWVLTSLGIPIAINIFFAANELVFVLYGERWAESAFYLRYLAIYSLASPFFGLGVWLAMALGHLRTTAWLSSISVILIIGLGTPLTLLLGASGTLIGVLTTMIVGAILACRYIFEQVHLSISEVFAPAAWATIISVIANAIIISGLSQSGWPAFLRLIVISATSWSVFGLVLLAIQPAALIARLRYLWITWQNQTLPPNS